MSTPRVLSLLPAAAETLWCAGGIHMLVGRGHEDDYPEHITQLPIVTASKIKFTTSAAVDAEVSASLAAAAASKKDSSEDDEGMYSLDVERIKGLRPSVILTQGLCSVCAVSQPQVYRIARQLDPVPEVVSLSPQGVEDIIADVIRVGKAVGLEDSAKEAAGKLTARVERAIEVANDARKKGFRGKSQGISTLISEGRNGAGEVSQAEEEEIVAPPIGNDSNGFHSITPSGGIVAPPNVCFMEWTDPIYAGGHWTPQLIHLAGGQHPLNPPLTDKGPAGASIKKTVEEVVVSDPDVIIVCPCGLDIKTTRVELLSVTSQLWWKGMRAVKAERVFLVDGHQMFNRSGPRIVDALEFLVGVLHDMPEMIPKDFPWEKL